MSQTSCPACAATAPADPGALGWSKIEGRWWCPLHAFGEQRRLKKQAAEIHWYDENIRLKKKALAKADADKEQVLSYARTHKIYKRDPELTRRVTAIDIRADHLREELAELQRNRDAAVQRQRKT